MGTPSDADRLLCQLEDRHGSREKGEPFQSFIQGCFEPLTSLRAKRSNPLLGWGKLDCFVASAPRNDEERSRQLVIPLAKPVQTQRESDALFGGLENDEGRG